MFAALVGNELQQRTIRIAEIDTHTGTLRAEALHRPGVDGNQTALEMRNRVGEGPVPFEAQVAVSRLHRQARDLRGMHSRAMQIELDGAEAVSPTLPAANELGAQHIAIKRVRTLPVGDMHHTMIERDGQLHEFILQVNPGPSKSWAKSILGQVNPWPSQPLAKSTLGQVNPWPATAARARAPSCASSRFRACRAAFCRARARAPAWRGPFR